MINEQEHRILADLERRMTAEDPGLALRLSGRDEWARWRSAWRWGMSVPILLLVIALSVTGFGLHISSLGVLFLLWALVGGMRRLVRVHRALA
jgi:lysylphosphatidylglycerol synthetase-like protein (DUF2156 family)